MFFELTKTNIRNRCRPGGIEERTDDLRCFLDVTCADTATQSAAKPRGQPFVARTPVSCRQVAQSK